jgi:peptidoglycan/xylan/chitin deacetylase (PgdA/CDA1 family)
MTFDDGGASYYTVVADRLEAFGWRGHCFIPTSKIGSAGFLDKRQIVELRARGHVIGSHSVSHPARISGLTPDQVYSEWHESVTVLEDLLGERISLGSVPAGYISSAVARLASEAGLAALFTSDPSVRSQYVQGCTLFGRFTVRGGMSTESTVRLARLQVVTRLQRWSEWTLKRMTKGVLGDGYQKLAHWTTKG